MKRKILIGTSSFAEADSTPLQRLKEADYEVMLNPHKRKLTKDELLTLLPGMDGLVAGLELIDREVLERSKLKVISRCGVGVSNVDLNAAKEFGIKVFSTPDAPTEAVAELTLANMLNLLRMIPQMNQDLHERRWKRQLGFQLKGKTVLIVGFGRIGRRVAELLKPFDVRILVADPIKHPRDILPYALLTLEEALPQADFVTLHCSGEACLMSKMELALMKKGSLLLNAARGSLVDEAALMQALREERIAGVWLDTFSQEPYSGKLTEFSQVILTPHVGSYTKEARTQMELQAVENLIAGLNGHDEKM